MNIRQTHLEFTSLSERPYTDMIVIHHTGEHDIDASAEQIHDWHLGNGWSGIGYHFVIRKDGTVEIGRPEWAIGSHAYGENSHTIGIHLSGDFETAYPSQAQLEACAELVHELCRDYGITCDRDHVVGHCDLMSTDCPGKNLYARLQDIIDAANGRGNAHDVPTVEGLPVSSIYDLARRYESNGNPAAIGHGYGLYQFTNSTVREFVKWLKNYPDDELANYGRVLDDRNKDFDATWTELGTVDPGHFAQLQDEFALENYFNAAEKLFAKDNFHFDKHSLQMQAVIFARAIQNGIFGALELFRRACPYPNLSYVDDMSFDKQMIAAVYDYLISNPTYGLGDAKLADALRNRFAHEKADALA